MGWKEKMKRIGSRVLIGFIIACVMICLTVYGVLNIYGFANFCNSDVYADTQLAQRIWEEKTLFPESWQFGNQFYVAATPVLAAVFYGITGSMNLAMVLATEMMTLLILVSFVWLLRSFSKDFLMQMLACLVLIAANVAPYGPYSVNALLFFTQSSFYSCYLITLFVVLGDYIRTAESVKTRPFSLIIALVLSFAMGMQSLRQTVVMVLPILACELFLTIHRWLRGQKPWNPNTLIRSISYALANLAGVAAIKIMNVPNTSIYGSVELASVDSLSQRLKLAAASFCEITSLDYVMAGECTAAVAIMILAMIAVVFVAALIWILRIPREKTGLEVCWLLCVVGIVGVILSTVLLNVTLRGIYLFLWFPLVACSVLLFLEVLPDLGKGFIIVVICTMSLVGMRDNYGIYLEILQKGELSDAEQLSQWAIEQGYEIIYGDYWEAAPGIAVYSDGQLQAGCWHTAQNVFYVEVSNTPGSIYTAEDNSKAIYVFTQYDVEAGLKTAAERGIDLTLMAEFGDYRAYTASEQLMRKWG